MNFVFISQRRLPLWYTCKYYSELWTEKKKKGLKKKKKTEHTFHHMNLKESINAFFLLVLKTLPNNKSLN